MNNFENYFKLQAKNIIVAAAVAVLSLIILPFVASNAIYFFVTPCSGCSVISVAGYMASVYTILAFCFVCGAIYLIRFHFEGKKIIENNSDNSNVEDKFIKFGMLTHKISVYLAGFFIFLTAVMLISVLFV